MHRGQQQRSYARRTAIGTSAKHRSPDAPFVCIEPWLGISDSINTKQDFTQKEGIQRLKAGETKVISFEIKIEV